MKTCILIPCFNHAASVAEVARAALVHGPVFVVDDGSTQPLPALPGCTLIRLGRNSGKAAALRAGFARATQEGFTHAITMDADGQHFAENLPKFLATAQSHPNALVVGVRDFRAAGCPRHRRRSNAVSTFWFRVETGVRLADPQCGFRCYPLALVQKLRTRSSRYAFEMEFMVRAAWNGAPIIAVPVRCTYVSTATGASHFRPLRDLAHITFINLGLVLQSWLVPSTLRAAWSRGERKSLRLTLAEFFCDRAHEPWRLACAVGLGLFFGVAPIWGCQMIAAAAVAHWLRLNKAIALLASNISIPPVMPFVLYGGLALGHWLFTGKLPEFSWRQMNSQHVFEYLGHWLVGSVVLGSLVASFGATATYAIIRLVRKR